MPTSAAASSTGGSNCDRLSSQVLRARPAAIAGEASADLVHGLAERGTRVVAYLGPAGLLGPFLAEADRSGWHPLVVLPGALADLDPFAMPRAFDGRVFLSYPYLPDDA